MADFYNKADQKLFEKYQYLPQEQYRLGLNVPINNVPINTEAEEINASFGIPNTEAFMASGDGNKFRGSYNQGDFQKAVDARQFNLSNPNNINQFVNKGLSFIGMEPRRSAEDMMESGVVDERLTSGIPLGIGAMIARGLPDRYYDMSLADQAFIQANMGYTGPTVFGDNNSGLSKDPFGINIRSMFGNYGDYVDQQVADYANITDEQLAELSNLQRQKVNFYRNKKIEREKLQADVLAAQMQRDAEAGAAGKSDPLDKSRAGAFGRRPGSGGTVDRVTSGPGRNVDDTGQAYDSGGREGFGYGLKNGGLASIL